MAGLAELFGDFLILVFTKIPVVGDSMALLLALVLLGWSLWKSISYYRKYHRPLILAVRERNKFLEDVTGGLTSKMSEARVAFAERFFEIGEAMRSVSSETDQAYMIQRAWEEYDETFVLEGDESVRNTVRPEHFFMGIADRHRALSWHANIVIAIGLLITFLGIIAALSTLNLSGGPDAMQSQLNDLMKVAGAKFWASAGGIAASIIFRLADFTASTELEEELHKLCDLLEHGMVYVPPQQIANDQLEQLKQQTPALNTFAEQLAVVLDEALQKQFAPMVSSLGSIQTGIETISGGGGEAVRKAISEGAGAEMGDLAKEIAGMTLSLSTMTDRLAQQTSSADQQIEEAVRRFGQASEEMRAAFGELNSNFEAVAERLRADSEAASAQAKERMQELLSEMGTTIQGMRDQMSSSAEAFGKATQNAAQDAARTGQAAMQESFASFVSRFNEAGGPLVDEMQKASTSISGAATSLESGNRAMGDYSRGIEEVANRSSDIATSLGSVANDVREATSPLRESASSIEQALLAMSSAVAADARNAEGNREEMREIATTLKSTSEAAQNAWSDYRARFNEVDEALGRALTMLTQATESHAQNLNERVGQVDEALAKGVTSLAGALKPLENLSDTVEDLSKTIQNAQVSSES